MDDSAISEMRTNLGTGGTRNVGIREARTEFVAFLDADDRWYPTFLETQLHIL